MKCYICKNCRKSKKKDFKFFCEKFNIYVQDELNGCINGEEKIMKE